jgi:hypothetical protein
MKKTILLTMLSLTLLNACAYKPIIDTAGRSSSSFNESQAKEISNDLQHCKTMAKENSTFVGNILYWTISPTMDTKKESLTRKCLTNRGHSVLN